MNNDLIPLPLAPWGYRNHDVIGIVIAVNDLYQHHPEMFGNEETREAMKSEIAQYMAAHDERELDQPSFYSFFVELLDRYELNPFQQASIAVVGGWSYIGGKTQQTIKPAMPLIEKFKEFHDISIERKGEPLIIANARDLAEDRKLDYVITGNVINAPNNDKKADTIVACANLLKAGGKAIHLVGYGESTPSGIVGDEKLYALARQKNVWNLPAGPYHVGSFGEGTEVMVFEQAEEVALTPDILPENSTEVAPATTVTGPKTKGPSTKKGKKI